MIVLVVVLAVVAAAAIVAAIVDGRRLRAQRALTAAAEERAASAEAASADANAALAQAQEARIAAEERAAEAGAPADGHLDPRVLWTLEQARSERTWRHSVAPGPHATSVFADAANPLVEALQVELDAAREEVGAVVELEADLPTGVTAAGSVLTLRAAQELLAGVVRRAEEATLHVHAEESDVLVTVQSVDEDGQAVDPEPLELPPSESIEPIDGGVRIRHAISPEASAS
jgi:pyruvate/2-oxoglutarate dehydrogenase complex dihydrolipoamide acyltransferase (E2) component